MGICAHACGVFLQDFAVYCGGYMCVRSVSVFIRMHSCPLPLHQYWESSMLANSTKIAALHVDSYYYLLK